MDKEQEKILRALKTGELAKKHFTDAGGAKNAFWGPVKHYPVEKIKDIIYVAENNSNLQLQKANQAQRA